MDGPTIGMPGGGGFIASAFVEVGADLSGLRAAEEEAKQIVSRIGAMGGGGSIGNPVNGAASGGMMMIQLKVDEQGLRSQLDSFFRSYQPPAIKIQVQTEGVGGGDYTVGGTRLGGSPSHGVSGGTERIAGLGTQGNQILAAMQHNLAESQAQGDVIGIAKFQGIIASLVGTPTAIATSQSASLGGGSVHGGTPSSPTPQGWGSVPGGWMLGGIGGASTTASSGIMYGPGAPQNYPPNPGFASFGRQPSLAALTGAETPVSDMEQNWQGYQSQHPAGPGWKGIGFRRAMMIGYLADRAFRSVGGFVNAGDIEANPGRIAAGYALSADSATTAPFAGAMAQAQAAQARYSAIESFPIVGGLIGLTGMQNGLNFDAMRAQQAMGAAIALHSQAEAGSVSSLAISGDTVAAAQRRAQLAEHDASRKMFAARSLTSKWNWGTLGFVTHAYTPQDVIDDYDSTVELGRDEVAAARRADNAVFTLANADASSSQFRADAARSLASFAPGSRMESLRLRQAARRAALKGQLDADVDRADPLHVGLEKMLRTVRLSEDTEVSKQETASAQRQSGIEIGDIRAQGAAAEMLARHDPYGAKLITFDRAAARARLEASAESPAYQEQLEFSLRQQRGSITSLHNEEVSNAFGNAGVAFGNSLLSVQAAGLRMQNRGAEADLLSYQAQQAQLAEAMRQQLAQLNFGNVGTILPNLIGLAGQGVTLGANQAAAQFAFQREQALQTANIDARFNIATELLYHHPRTAGAIGAVARARAELENAPADQRSNLSLTLMRELQAQEHAMGPIGGLSSINMGVSAAAGYAGGISLDLGLHAQDRLRARQTYERGIDGVINGGLGGVPQVTAAATDIAKLAPLLASAVRFLEKLTQSLPN